MDIKTIREITIKELKHYLDHLSGYLLLSIFLGIIYFLFLKTFFVVGIASLRNMFGVLPWVFVIFIPAITMGSFAKEEENQTIEYLFTRPIKFLEIIVGKILGATTYLYTGVLLTLPVAFFINLSGNMDIGETVAGYLGTLLLIIGMTSIGVTISALFKSQIPAFLTTAIVLLTLNIAGDTYTAINLPQNISKIVSQISLTNPYFSLIRGVYDSGSIIYFAIIVLISILLTYSRLSAKRISSTNMFSPKTLNKGLYGIAAVILLVTLSQFLQARVDLTSSQKYTLSPVTKDVVKSDGKIKIDVYASNNMPQQYQNILGELKNILSDYDRTGGSNLNVNYFDPNKHQEALSQLGISPIQFNVIGQDQFQIKQGYLALAISDENANKQEIIDFIDSIDNIEYTLTTIINRIKNDTKPVIAISTGKGERSLGSEYNALQELISNDFDVDIVRLEDEPESLTDVSKYPLLIIANPTDHYSKTALEGLLSYVRNGGNIIYLFDTVNVDPINISIENADLAIVSSLFESEGIKGLPGVVYDLRANLPVSLPADTGSIQIPYPFFTLIQKNLQAKDMPLVNNLPEQIISPWAGALEIEEESGWEVIYSTSRFAGIQKDSLNLDPRQEFSTNALGHMPIIAAQKFDEGGTIIVSANAKILDTQFLTAAGENQIFALSLIDSLGQGKGFSEIKAKDTLLSQQFLLLSDAQKGLIKLVGPTISFMVLGLIGASRMWRISQMKKIFTPT